MLLKISGFELEIIEGKFVCFTSGNGETSHFCEWKYLAPQLQEKFKAIRQQLMCEMKTFVHSGEGSTFLEISEEYRREGHNCQVL